MFLDDRPSILWVVFSSFSSLYLLPLWLASRVLHAQFGARYSLHVTWSRQSLPDPPAISRDWAGRPRQSIVLRQALHSQFGKLHSRERKACIGECCCSAQRPLHHGRIAPANPCGSSTLGSLQLFCFGFNVELGAQRKKCQAVGRNLHSSVLPGT